MARKYELQIHETDFVIINAIEDKAVVWINKEHSTLEKAKEVVENFNRSSDIL